MYSSSKNHFLSNPCLVVPAVVGILLSVGTGHAQVTTSSIVGTVTDSTGALVPDANVTITDTERNQTKTTVSNHSGEFRVDFLKVGNYSVTVSVAGFKNTFRRESR